MRRRHGPCDAWSDLRTGTLIEKRPTMKKLMILLVFGTLLVGASGCHVCECWNYAWNSRFHPELVAPRQQAVTVVDPCDGPMVVEPSGGGCGCGVQSVTPGPVPIR
jgi:hypothetical protein